MERRPFYEEAWIEEMSLKMFPKGCNWGLFSRGKEESSRMLGHNG